jgi:hypothetical protein
MNTFIIFLQAITPNLSAIFLVICFFLLTTVVGFLYLNYFFRIKNIVIVPAAMIAGVNLFILYLAIFSYLFKGQLGILIITIIFSVTGLLMLFITPHLKLIWHYLFSIKNAVVLLICLSWIFFIFLIGGANIYGGDVIAYWGFATSFANGNYPLMSPWQPSILANHHQGIYLYEGAIYALIPVSITLIHTLFSIFTISSGFFLLWSFTALITKRTFLSLICPLIFFVLQLIRIPIDANSTDAGNAVGFLSS